MSSITNIKVRPMNVSWAGSAFGFTEGDLEFTTEDQLVDITTHQTGTNVVSAIRTGKNASIALVLKETSADVIKYLYGQSGSLETASGASGEVLGWGSKKDFTHVLDQAAKLVLHPSGAADTDLSEDIAAWKAYPMVESMTFSGENPNTVSLTFRIFPDLAKAPEFQLFVFGNHEDGDFTEVEP